MYLKTDTERFSNHRLTVVTASLSFPQEEGLRKGGEPKYAHLSMELHVFIEVFAPVPDAYLRMAHAMEEVKKFLFPVSSAPCRFVECVTPVNAVSLFLF